MNAMRRTTSVITTAAHFGAKHIDAGHKFVRFVRGDSIT